jgi:hypothetical protein
MTNTRHGFTALAAVCSLLLAGSAAAQGPASFTEDFQLEDCTFSNEGRNPFFSLEPGDKLVLEGDDDGEEVRVRILILDATKTIQFRTEGGTLLRVNTRVVEEREWADDELVEVSRNYFARCRETNDVFYFGEAVDIYEDGEIVSHDGAWLAGRKGARPGLIMPGRFLLGSRYFQEIAPDVALDRAENTEMGLELDLPAGTFEDCVKIVETSPLEPGHESIKHYCPGVGLAIDSGIELVDFDIDND